LFTLVNVGLIGRHPPSRSSHWCILVLIQTEIALYTEKSAA